MRAADLIVLSVAFGGPVLLAAGTVLLVLRIAADVTDDRAARLRDAAWAHTIAAQREARADFDPQRMETAA
jgi:hypothetical protein